MLQIFAEVLIPVYLVVAIGYALARLVGAAHKNVVTLSYWVLGPAFTFNVLATANLSAGAVLQIVVATVATMTVIGLAAAGFGRIAGTPRSLTSASILTSIYPNAGNFGLAMAVFALGPEALPAAGLVLVASNSYGILVGVGLANIEKASPLIALRKAVTTPLVLALIPAIVVNVTNFDVPIWFDRPVELLAGAMIPVMLLALGLQIAAMPSLKPDRLTAVPISLKLVAAPVVAAAFVNLLGIAGTSAGVIVLVSGMPAAVFTSLIALEHDLEPDFVTSVVLGGTLISVLTLPVVLSVI